jgi:hypothetical protein
VLGAICAPIRTAAGSRRSNVPSASCATATGTRSTPSTASRAYRALVLVRSATFQDRPIPAPWTVINARSIRQRSLSAHKTSISSSPQSPSPESAFGFDYWGRRSVSRSGIGSDTGASWWEAESSSSSESVSEQGCPRASPPPERAPETQKADSAIGDAARILVSCHHVGVHSPRTCRRPGSSV